MDKATRLIINELAEQLEANSEALEAAIKMAEKENPGFVRMWRRIIEHNDSKRTRALELLD